MDGEQSLVDIGFDFWWNRRADGVMSCRASEQCLRVSGGTMRVNVNKCTQETGNRMGSLPDQVGEIGEHMTTSFSGQMWMWERSSAVGMKSIRLCP